MRHPSHGGCNSGFSTEAWYTPAQARAALNLPEGERPSWTKSADEYAAHQRKI